MRKGNSPSFLVLMFLVTGAALAESSCGGGNAGSSCGPTEACGGDVVGAWKVTSSCFAAAPGAFPVMGCPGAAVNVSGLTLTGTDVFKPDKTEQTTASYDGSISVTYPSSCLTSYGSPPNCDLVTAVFAAEIAGSTSDTPFKSVACKSGGGGCVCTLPTAPNVTSVNSTYSTSGGVLTETDSTGEVTQSTYCVVGDMMTQHVDGMANEGLSGTITLMKQ
jgi:hypothetical protein